MACCWRCGRGGCQSAGMRRLACRAAARPPHPASPPPQLPARHTPMRAHPPQHAGPVQQRDLPGRRARGARPRAAAVGRQPRVAGAVGGAAGRAGLHFSHGWGGRAGGWVPWARRLRALAWPTHAHAACRSALQATRAAQTAALRQWSGSAREGRRSRSSQARWRRRRRVWTLRLRRHLAAPSACLACLAVSSAAPVVGRGGWAACAPAPAPALLLSSCCTWLPTAVPRRASACRRGAVQQPRALARSTTNTYATPQSTTLEDLQCQVCAGDVCLWAQARAVLGVSPFPKRLRCSAPS